MSHSILEYMGHPDNEQVTSGCCIGSLEAMTGQVASRIRRARTLCAHRLQRRSHRTRQQVLSEALEELAHQRAALLSDIEQLRVAMIKELQRENHMLLERALALLVNDNDHLRTLVLSRSIQEALAELAPRTSVTVHVHQRDFDAVSRLFAAGRTMSLRSITFETSAAVMPGQATLVLEYGTVSLNLQQLSKALLTHLKESEGAVT